MAALPPAGVSLQAEGFRDYLNKLDAIDKKQRAVFDADFKGTEKSYNEVTKAAQKYEKELRDLAKAEKRAAQDAQKLAAAQKTAAATQQQAFISAGTAVLDFAQKVGTVLVESSKLAAQFEGQRTGLNNLAASFGQSGTAIQSAIQKASKGTVSGLDAINAANQGLLLGVAQTPAEFANLTENALTLGRTLGLTGTQAIEQFTTALGRQSLLILDNFGISAKQVNTEIERLAKADFGKARSQLSDAQKQATFMKAALNIAGKAAAAIGDEAGNAQAAFERLEATSQNLKVTFGTLAQPLGTGIANALSKAAKTAQQLFAFIGAGFAGVGKIASGIFGNIFSLFKGEATRTIDDILDEAGVVAIGRFKEIASTIEGVSFDDEKIVEPLEKQAEAIALSEEVLKSYQSALKQAEDLQLSFTRTVEDSALKLARANEDVARKQAQSVTKLERRQTKDRDKLLKDQTKQFDDFEKDRRKQISKAEDDIRQARREAGEQRKRDQKKLQREIQQAQDRFNLSRLQSERRFSLQESRLRAEGDILGLKELREDFALSQQEEKENFAQSTKEQKSSAKVQQKTQDQDLKKRLDELKGNLEDRRAELLASFDVQLAEQAQAQEKARIEQQRGFDEAAAERQIQLAREEEDRRISQRRQIEDLGRSLAEQQGVTAEGATAIAGELEKIFGIDGVADNIMTGFTEKTESDFVNLFKDLEDIVSKVDIEPDIPVVEVPIVPRGLSSGGFGGRIGGVQEFQEGGVVGGPAGSPQIIQAHAGETILPTHKQSFTMAAPIVPSQSLDVTMGGGFNISGGEQAGEAAVQAAVVEMTENFRIAVKRLARRN